MQNHKVLLLIAFLLVIGAGCSDHNIDPNGIQVFSLSTKIDGNGFNELVQTYTKWVLDKPLDKTPLNDDSVGTFHAADRQPLKNVTILTSNFGGTTARSLSISSDNYVFLPLITSSPYYYENDLCDPTFKPVANQTLEDFLKMVAAAEIDGVTNLSAKFDGQDIVPDLKPYRISTKTFQFFLDKDYANLNCDYSGQQATVVDDGYYLLIKVPKGKHTITYTADLPVYNFALNMTWNLTVN